MSVDAGTLWRWHDTARRLAIDICQDSHTRKTLEGLASELREAYLSTLREEVNATPVAEGTGKT